MKFFPAFSDFEEINKQVKEILIENSNTKDLDELEKIKHDKAIVSQFNEYFLQEDFK